MTSAFTTLADFFGVRLSIDCILYELEFVSLISRTLNGVW